MLRPLALLISHLLAAGLATVSINPALVKPPGTVPTPAPVWKSHLYAVHIK